MQEQDFEKSENYEALTELYRKELELIGENPYREGLLKTPSRVAKSMLYLTSGYNMDPLAVLQSAKFNEDYKQMVIVKNIDFFSMCEHHMLPFYGKAHVAYIPDGKVVGLSKLARTVEVYARRLQIQEKMTGQIADAIMENLSPKGVMVMVEAEHMCMTMRGVKKPGSQTVSIAARGVFQENDRLQKQFFGMLGVR